MRRLLFVCRWKPSYKPSLISRLLAPIDVTHILTQSHNFTPVSNSLISLCDANFQITRYFVEVSKLVRVESFIE